MEHSSDKLVVAYIFGISNKNCFKILFEHCFKYT